MDDFTKIKLINSLIDVVERFYELKTTKAEEAKHLKGFCEGMAYTLLELNYLSQEEVTKILKGVGKKRENSILELKDEEIFAPQTSFDDENNLDIPTFIRKK